MKKLAVLSMVIVLGAGAAMAASLSVPFFADNGGNLTGGVPANNGSAAFIGLVNNLGTPVDIVVTYTTQVPGEDPIPEVTATFTLGANAQVSWRPFADDPAEASGRAIGNVAALPFGSARIQFTNTAGATSVTDIQGRYVEINAAGNRFSYLLPPGN